MLQKLKYYMVQYLIPLLWIISIHQFTFFPFLQQWKMMTTHILINPTPKLHTNYTHLQSHSNVKLQLAATFCVSNLIWNEEDGKIREHASSQSVESSMAIIFCIRWRCSGIFRSTPCKLHLSASIRLLFLYILFCFLTIPLVIQVSAAIGHTCETVKTHNWH